jgi:hypothetical protein
MKLPAVSPQLVVSLVGLYKAGFSADQVQAIEFIFKNLFNNLVNNQKQTAQVINFNSLVTYPTASLPVASASLNNSAAIEFTGTTYNLVIYTSGVRKKVALT